MVHKKDCRLEGFIIVFIYMYLFCIFLSLSFRVTFLFLSHCNFNFPIQHGGSTDDGVCRTGPEIFRVVTNLVTVIRFYLFGSNLVSSGSRNFNKGFRVRPLPHPGSATEFGTHTFIPNSLYMPYILH